MRLETCYRVLELTPDASIEEVKRSYRELAQVWHPDRFAGKPKLQSRAEEKLKEINEAYRCLLEADQRPQPRVEARTSAARAWDRYGGTVDWTPAGDHAASGAGERAPQEARAGSPGQEGRAADASREDRGPSAGARLLARVADLLWDSYPGLVLPLLLLAGLPPLRFLAGASSFALTFIWWRRTRPRAARSRLAGALVLVTGVFVGAAGLVTPPPAPVLSRTTGAGGPELHWRAAAVGGDHACALTTDGRLYCWGANDVGQLGDSAALGRCRGDGENYLCSARPQPAAGALRFRSVAAGSDFTCALDSEGRAWCWGAGFAGQLGNDAFERSSEPVAVADGLHFQTLSALGQHACGLSIAGTAWCWGRDTDGQLGEPDAVRECRAGRLAFGCSPEPVAVPATEAWVQVVAGATHSCALTPGGVAYCWGANTFGQLGGRDPAVCPHESGSNPCALRPDSVLTDLRFQQLAAGSAHTCGITREGRAYCWGRNDVGQLGTGSTADVGRPVAVLTNERFARILAGGRHTCGLTAAGALLCWGQNAYGQLGSASRDRCDSTPCSPVPQRARVPGRVADAATGYLGTCALTAEAQFCWGPNNSGQLGTGTVAASARLGSDSAAETSRGVRLIFARIVAEIRYPIDGVLETLRRLAPG